MELAIGHTAPDFALKDQNGKVHKLSDYRGKTVFLYFYPKDDTPGCTIEACSIRDNFSKFKKHGVVVLGVSIDPEKNHAKFVKKFELPFTLLADDKRELVKTYSVWGEKEFMGRTYMGTYRTSFLIGPNGKIKKIYEGVNPKTHIAVVLKDLS